MPGLTENHDRTIGLRLWLGLRLGLGLGLRLYIYGLCRGGRGALSHGRDWEKTAD